MPLQTIVAATPASQLPQAEIIETAVRELQGLKVAVVAGGLAAAQLTLTGIATQDVLVGVLRFDVDTGTVIGVSSVTSEASIPATNKIALSTTDTTGDTLVVLYFHLP